MEVFHAWLLELNSFSGIAGITYFMLYRKKINTIYGVVFLLIAASTLADCSNYFFMRLVYQNSYIIGNLWFLLNFGISIWLFSKILPNHKILLIVLSCIFYVGAVLSFITTYSFTDSNSFIKVSSSIVFTFLALRLYFELLKKPTGSLKFNPIFWIATALFLFSSLSLLRNLFLQYLVFDLEIGVSSYIYISTIYLLANISKNLILFYALTLIDKGHLLTLTLDKEVK
ncbi:MAG: hypothetical protein RLN88_05600 [Ekhidna sp.]|uniref:hypothetical protein n=1 Tax=Ekhidna sp. TaxID=2608089 RepID=UPI0032ECFBA5